MTDKKIKLQVNYLIDKDTATLEDYTEVLCAAIVDSLLNNTTKWKYTEGNNNHIKNKRLRLDLRYISSGFTASYMDIYKTNRAGKHLHKLPFSDKHKMEIKKALNVLEARAFDAMLQNFNSAASVPWYKRIFTKKQ